MIYLTLKFLISDEVLSQRSLSISIISISIKRNEDKKNLKPRINIEIKKPLKHNTAVDNYWFL